MSETIKTYHKPKNGSTFTEITSYVTGTARANIFRGRKRVQNGNLTFDDSLPVTILPNDEVKLEIDNGTTQFHIFTGLFVPSNESPHQTGWRIEGLERFFKTRRLSGVFLSKTRTEVLRLIIDEKFPELTYDDTSLPLTGDTETLDHRFNAKKCSDIFDKYGDQTGRIWYIDKNKKVWVVTESWPDTGYTIDDALVYGRAAANFDITKWQTKVRVEGAVTEIVFQEDFTGTQITALSKIVRINKAANTLEIKQIPSGSGEGDVAPLRGAIAGTDQDITNLDYTYDPKGPQITFTDQVSVTASDTFRIKQVFPSQITAEAINPVSFQKHGEVTGPVEQNKLITTQSQADSLAQSLADARGEPIPIYTLPTAWSENIVPGGSVTLNTTDSFPQPVNRLTKVTELNLIWDSNGVDFRVMLNGAVFDSIEAFEEMQIRIRQLEEKETAGETFVKKIILWYANMAVELHKIRVHSYAIGNAFTYDVTDASGMYDNPDRYLDGVDGSGSLTDEGSVEVYGPNDRVKLFFWDSEEFDTSSSTATLDTTNRKVVF